MLSHAKIWSAIDRLARKNGLTPSGLARRAGLDPTTFNKSKRASADGRPRWPSTESIAKILHATRTDIAAFLGFGGGEAARVSRPVPVIGLAQAGPGGFFDGGGYPAGQGWDEVELPTDTREGIFALKVKGDSMLPLYRNGDTVIVDRDKTVRKGDRVVVSTHDGEVMAKVLGRKSARALELVSLNPAHADRTLPLKDVDWIGRIIWASQ